MFSKLTHPLFLVLLLTLANSGWAAMNPNPSDGATDVPLIASLSWSSFFEVQYDVYFGTDMEAVAAAHRLSPEYRGRQWDTTYDPDFLTPGTTYYWRIDDVSGELIFPGPVWSFTTESMSFTMATNPNPHDHATDVPPDAIISWTAAPGAYAHDVYFGTDPEAISEASKDSPEYRGRQEAEFNAYDPGPLQPSRSYYWRIDAVVDMGMYYVVYVGFTWDFTTASGDESLVFAQMDFDLDGMIYTDTEWGAVDFSFVGQEPIMYFNLAVNGTWQVQNIPVLSIEGVDVEQTMTYHFDLGTDRGINVDGLNYDYVFTPDIIDTMPARSIPATVVEREVVFSPGAIETEIVSMSLVSAKPLIGGAAKTPTKYAHKDFPNQECDANECSPTAVSNSLKFLNKKWSLGIKDDKLTIDEMKKATNWGEKKIGGKVVGTGCWIDPDSGRPAGERNAWWEDKKKYMKDNKYPITTRKITDLAKIVDEIKDGQDVELQGDWHTAAIVGITDLGGGKFSIDVAHDTEQGKAGGTKTETITYDPNTKEFSGSPGFFDGSSFRYAVVECPSYYVLDGFESYLPGEILVSWTDGMSVSTDPDLPSNGTGSKVDLSTVTVHGGEQSMAFEYRNGQEWPEGFYSETGRTFETPQDWTRPGMEALSLWFHGNPENDPEQMYVALQDSGGRTWVVYNDNPFALQGDDWQPWSVGLQQFTDAGLDLGSIGTTYIGVGTRGETTTPGGTGVVHFDDIVLCTPTCLAEHAPLGDVNLDCVVDFADVATVANSWLATMPLACPSCTADKKCRYTLNAISWVNCFGDWTGPELDLDAKCVANRCLNTSDCDPTIIYKEYEDPNNPSCYMKLTWKLDDCTETLVERDCNKPFK
ncbi:MAG: hypothetical protein JSU70_17295 [Phycisphaerales bacterium]|nr:MAG: hypothetical protein JSU70_17295 [Phycisphaerales bacterium]